MAYQLRCRGKAMGDRE